MGIVLFWLLWGGVFLLATLNIVMRLAIMTLLTMGRKPLLGIATFAILVTIGFAMSMYVLLSTFALDSSNHVTSQSLEIGAFAFLVVAIVFVAYIRNSGRTFVHLARRYRASRLLRGKRYAAALIYSERMVARHPGDAYAWYGQAQSLVGLHRNIETLASCEKALAATTAKPSSIPLRSHILLLKGGTLFSLYRVTEALAALDQALALNPNYSFAWAQKAYILQRSGSQEQALAAAERALTLDGREIASAKIWQGMALVAKAGALNGIGKYAEALDTARRALPLASQSSPVWIIQANALAHLGHPEESRAAANQGLAKVEQQIADDSERWDYWDNKSVLLRILGRESEAEIAEAQARALLTKHATFST